MSTLETVRSADGTTIAFERSGDGPPVILVGGAFNDRTTVAGVAASLAPSFTAVAFDRRGRGESGVVPVTSADREREIEDLAALIEAVGGSAYLFGHSSGAVLALEATRRLAVAKLAVYEPPFIVDGSRPRPEPDFGKRLRTLLSEGRRDDAVALFQTEGVGLPPEAVDGMRGSEMWAWFVGFADSLAHDEALFDPGHAVPSRLAAISVPVLAIDGGETWPWLRDGTKAVADAISGSRYVTLAGEDHGVLGNPEALRPLLVEFFS